MSKKFKKDKKVFDLKIPFDFDFLFTSTNFYRKCSLKLKKLDVYEILCRFSFLKIFRTQKIQIQRKFDTLCLS